MILVSDMLYPVMCPRKSEWRISSDTRDNKIMTIDDDRPVTNYQNIILIIY